MSIRLEYASIRRALVICAAAWLLSGCLGYSLHRAGDVVDIEDPGEIGELCGIERQRVKTSSSSPDGATFNLLLPVVLVDPSSSEGRIRAPNEWEVDLVSTTLRKKVRQLSDSVWTAGVDLLRARGERLTLDKLAQEDWFRNEKDQVLLLVIGQMFPDGPAPRLEGDYFVPASLGDYWEQQKVLQAGPVAWSDMPWLTRWAKGDDEESTGIWTFDSPFFAITNAYDRAIWRKSHWVFQVFPLFLGWPVMVVADLAKYPAVLIPADLIKTVVIDGLVLIPGYFVLNGLTLLWDYALWTPISLVFFYPVCAVGDLFVHVIPGTVWPRSVEAASVCYGVVLAPGRNWRSWHVVSAKSIEVEVHWTGPRNFYDREDFHTVTLDRGFSKLASYLAAALRNRMTSREME